MAYTDPYSDQELYDDGCWLAGITPSPSNYPNLVVHPGPRSLKNVASIVKHKIATWPDAPYYDKDGALRDDDDNPSNLDPEYPYSDYPLWKASVNQKLLWEHFRGYGRGQYANVYLNADLPPKLIREFEDYMGSLPEDPDDSELLWKGVTKYLDTFRWAYLPASYEFNMAVVVTRPEDAQWIDEMKCLWDSQGEPFSSIIEVDGKETWRLPPRLRELM